MRSQRIRALIVNACGLIVAVAFFALPPKSAAQQGTYPCGKNKEEPCDCHFEVCRSNSEECRSCETFCGSCGVEWEEGCNYMEQGDQYCPRGSYYDGCACAMGGSHK